VTVEAALDAFIAKKQGQHLSHSWLYKFSLMHVSSLILPAVAG
jgi:hypothetical protein